MENWKPVVGFEACYAVSDLGNVARTATYGQNPKPKWKLCARRSKRGYVAYHLCQDGVSTDALAHRLIWEAFKGPIPAHLEINHKNGKRDDNRIANLELMTPSQNLAHSFRVLGRKAANNPSLGSKNGSAKLSEKDIPAIIALYDSGLHQWQIGEKFGVSQKMISLILRGEKWQHISRRHFRHS